MKTLIVQSSSGEYDYYQETIEEVLIVPDDFIAETDQRVFFENIRTSPPVGIFVRKDGHISDRHINKVWMLWRESLRSRFEVVKWEVYLR